MGGTICLSKWHCLLFSVLFYSFSPFSCDLHAFSFLWLGMVMMERVLIHNTTRDTSARFRVEVDGTDIRGERGRNDDIHFLLNVVQLLPERTTKEKRSCLSFR